MDQRPKFRGRVQGVSHPDAVDPLFQRSQEPAGDPVLYQQAAAGGTALPVQAVDHEHHRVQGALEIGVIEDDDRVLAAQFHVDSFQGGCRLAHDVCPGHGFPDETDGLDGGMLGQCLAGALAETVNGIPDPVRQAGLPACFRQEHGRQGAEFRGLVDHGATGCQGRRDLPGRQHERRVPRGNDADRADGRAFRVVQVLVLVQRQAVAGFRRLVGKEAEVLRAARRGRAHETDRLAAVHAFHQGYLLGAPFDQIGKAVEDFPALFSGGAGPGGECLLRGPAGAVDILRRTRGDKSQRGIVRRRQVLEGFAGNARTGLTINIMRGDAVPETA